MIKGFAPIGNADAEVLILGSMPSIASLYRQEYYAHPQNRFWKLLSVIYRTELTCYDHKIACLHQNKLALWDVIATCEREGSLDSKIKEVSQNELESFLSQHVHIRKIILNGQKAGKEYQKSYGSAIQIPWEVLPSTSPANASCSFDILLNLWQKALTDYDMQ